MALLDDPRAENGSETVALKRTRTKIPGLPFSDMTRDQRELVDRVLADLLLPFRQKDTDEAMKFIREKRRRGSFDYVVLQKPGHRQ
jgi:hypothetical protein